MLLNTTWHNAWRYVRSIEKQMDGGNWEVFRCRVSPCHVLTPSSASTCCVPSLSFHVRFEGPLTACSMYVRLYSCVVCLFVLITIFCRSRQVPPPRISCRFMCSRFSNVRFSFVDSLCDCRYNLYTREKSRRPLYQNTDICRRDIQNQSHIFQISTEGRRVDNFRRARQILPTSAISLVSFVHLSARATPTGRIFVKVHIWDFSLNFFYKFRLWVMYHQNNIQHQDLRAF
jgi:hypothetical protein